MERVVFGFALCLGFPWFPPNSPDPREDLKSRSLKGVPINYPLVARVTNWGIYFLDPPGDLGQSGSKTCKPKTGNRPRNQASNPKLFLDTMHPMLVSRRVLWWLRLSTRDVIRSISIKHPEISSESVSGARARPILQVPITALPLSTTKAT